MQKSLGLEIERMVDVVLRARQLCRGVYEYRAKDGAAVDVANAIPDRCQDLLVGRVRQESLPKPIIVIDVMLERIASDRPPVAPRIAGKQLIPACSGQHHF